MKLSDEKWKEIRETLKGYMRAKEEWDRHIEENNRWYRAQYMGKPSACGEGEMVAPSTGFLFNALVNKHADAMDAYPSVRFYERHPDGCEEAKMLSMVVPSELERMNFRETYSRGWWYKLKHGAVCYGVFYESAGKQVQIKRLDVRNLYWAPGVENIQDSPYLFALSHVPKKDILARYPDLEEADIESDFHCYEGSGNLTQDGYTVVVDAYEKVRIPSGKTVLHLTKFCGETVLDSTLFYPELTERGLYDHGKYPVVMDVLYPIDGSPIGFGLVDVAKNPQCYIDKLDEIISKNALAAGKIRFMIKDNGGVNEEELLDMKQDLIHVAGALGEENIRAFQTEALAPYIIAHRQNKITELKEITGNREVTVGGVQGNITGYSAIHALQTAGQKSMRDMLFESYGAFREIIGMCTELFRQFYTTTRVFRTSSEKTPFVRWSGADFKSDLSDFEIRIATPHSTDDNESVQNELAITLFEKGFFDKAHREEALAALRMMEFEGKTQVEAYIENSAEA